MVVPLSVSDRGFAVDAATIVAVSAAICLAADQLPFMSVLVPIILLLRLLVWSQLALDDRGHSLRVEVVFVVICTVLGAFNDWNSVHRHRIYDYTVPVENPAWSLIPVWMLLYWGMILRFFVTLARWRRLGPPESADNRLRIPALSGQAVAKVLALLVCVMLTRQMIYRYYLDPFLSWLPFAAGLAAYAAVFPVTKHDLKLLGIFALGGPAIEILYIQVGHLHSYHLGWLAGVPLWIALWWLVAILVWKDLGLRVLQVVQNAVD